MATVGDKYPNLVNILKRTDPDGGIAEIVEMMALSNPVLNDIPFYECNDGTKHVTTIRTGLSEPTWRAYYEGVQPTHSETAQVEDSCGMLEDRSAVDKKLADKNGNAKDFRISEDRAKLEGMNQEAASTLFYGNSKENARKFLGLAPRFDHISTNKTDIGFNVIDGGGTGSVNASIWFGCWGKHAAHGLFPKGFKAGFQHQDLGEKDELDGKNKPFRAYVSLYSWDLGLTVRDWRSWVRVANIDTDELADAGETGFDGANLPNLMIRAYNRQKNRGLGIPVIYCNETVKTALDLLASNKSNTFFTISDGIDGNPVTRFRGIPIRQVDALVDAEERVLAA